MLALGRAGKLDSHFFPKHCCHSRLTFFFIAGLDKSKSLDLKKKEDYIFGYLFGNKSEFVSLRLNERALQASPDTGKAWAVASTELLFPAAPAMQAGLDLWLVALTVTESLSKNRDVNSGPFHVYVIAASESFSSGRVIAAVQFVPASAGDTYMEFEKSLTNAVPNCGTSLHPCP